MFSAARASELRFFQTDETERKGNYKGNEILLSAEEGINFIETHFILFHSIS